MRIHDRVLRACIAAAPALLTACTSGQVAVTPKVSAVDVSKSAKLQLAVGTSTIALADGTAFVGLNMVATFRGSDGNNATQVNTPTFTAPAGVAFPVYGSTLGGVLPSDFIALADTSGYAAVNGSPNAQSGASGAPNPLAAFGYVIGVYGYGLGAYNMYPARFETGGTTVDGSLVGNEGVVQGCIDVNRLAGSSASATGPSPIQPPGAQNGFQLGYGELDRTGANLTSPLFAGDPAQRLCSTYSAGPAFADTANQLFPLYYFGGPPAWPAPQGFGNVNTFYAYPLGFTDFAVAPAPGSYGLSVAFPTSNDFKAYGHLNAQAQLSALGGLPVFKQPVLTVNTADGSGTVAFDVPAGATEAVVDVTTLDCDFRESGIGRGPNTSNHYSVFTRVAGHNVAFISGLLGPPDSSGAPTHTFCTAADIAAGPAALGAFDIRTIVAAVAFDYPAYESSYPFSTAQSPPISGANGQADISKSYPLASTFHVTAGP